MTGTPRSETLRHVATMRDALAAGSTLADCAVRLGMSLAHVTSIAKRFGLTSRRDPTAKWAALAVQHETAFRRLVADGKGQARIAETLGLADGTVAHLARHYGLVLPKDRQTHAALRATATQARHARETDLRAIIEKKRRVALLNPVPTPEEAAAAVARFLAAGRMPTLCAPGIAAPVQGLEWPPA